MIGTLGQWLLGLRLRHALFALLVASLFASPGFAAAEPPYPVGLKQIEFTDGERQLALAMFYPAALSDSSAKPSRPPLLHQSASLQGRRAGRGPPPSGDAFAWARLEPAAICLVRRDAREPGLHRRRALSLSGQHLRPEHRLPLQQDLAAATRHLVGNRLSAEGQGVGQGDRRGEDRRRRSFAGRLHLALDRRRQGRCRQIPRLPAGLEEQSAGSGLSA